MAPQAGYVDPDMPSPMRPNDAEIIIYGYIPSVTLSAIAIALFSIAIVAHGYRTFRHRAWYFVPVFVTCLMELIGYIFRLLSNKDDPYNVPYFVVQYFFIVVAPVFLSASIYVCLTKLVGAGEKQGWMPEKITRPLLNGKALLWFFISCDVLTTVMQVTGAALIGSAESNDESPVTGNDILLAGLALQSFAFTLFIACFIVLYWSFSRNVHVGKSWNQPFIGVLAVSSLLVFLRTLFRLAETSQGYSGYLTTHEVFFGSLEFAPIGIAVILLAIWHPATSLRSEPREKPRMPGTDMAV